MIPSSMAATTRAGAFSDSFALHCLVAWGSSSFLPTLTLTSASRGETVASLTGPTVPLSFADNAAVISKVSEMAHQVGVSVEGEIGHLGSLESGRGEAEDGHGFEGI